MYSLPSTPCTDRGERGGGAVVDDMFFPWLLTLVLEEGGGKEINSCWGEGEGVAGMDMILMLCFFLGSDREVRGEGGGGMEMILMLCF